ncbi:hypothetical protein DVH24_022560 [Malus domestica]|uniref:ascorbate ferrireductase (transmembrane) n=1 Tax=Malus domestica TaxID=3750 RepID=A0A498KLR4_MALDO|nr:hypothetical protein DVH24_022560 [Malus domestica]
MALKVPAVAFTFVVHTLGVTALALVLVWTIHFRGGLAWEATNKNLIFNVHYENTYGIWLPEKWLVVGINGIEINKCECKSVDIHMPVQLHPVLMLLGIIIMGGEAIVSHKSLPFNKETKKVIHLVLHTLALALGIIGIYLVFKNHNESGIANLYSLHSWIGIGVIVLYGIQWIYGFLTFFYPGGSPTLKSESIPWHVVFGIIVYLLAVGNASLGFLEKLTFLENSGLDKFGTEAFLVNFTAIITVLFGIFVILSLHPVLMLLGLIILGGEVMVSYKSLPFNKKMKKVIHLVLHALALALGIIGIYLAFKNHNVSGIANMYSLHAWIGIGVIVLYGIQVFSNTTYDVCFRQFSSLWTYGFVTFFFPGGSPTLRRESILWHVVFGIIVYVLAVGDSSLGFLEKLTFLERSGLDKFGTEAFLVNFTTIITVLFGVFVIFSVISEAPPPVEVYYSYSSI